MRIGLFKDLVYFKFHKMIRLSILRYFRIKIRKVGMVLMCADILLHASFYHAVSVCFKLVIQSGRSLFLSKIKNTSLKLPVRKSPSKLKSIPVGVSPLQLVNLHSNRRYFVLKLHTWFCLSYFLKTNIKCYCIYQYCTSINSFFNTVSVSRYSRNFNS